LRGNGLNDYGDVRYGGESGSPLRTYRYRKEEISGIERNFSVHAELAEAMRR
jgi:hypothetical protein